MPGHYVQHANKWYDFIKIENPLTTLLQVAIEAAHQWSPTAFARHVASPIIATRVRRCRKAGCRSCDNSIEFDRTNTLRVRTMMLVNSDDDNPNRRETAVVRSLESLSTLPQYMRQLLQYICV